MAIIIIEMRQSQLLKTKAFLYHSSQSPSICFYGLLNLLSVLNYLNAWNRLNWDIKQDVSSDKVSAKVLVLNSIHHQANIIL